MPERNDNDPPDRPWERGNRDDDDRDDRPRRRGDDDDLPRRRRRDDDEFDDDRPRGAPSNGMATAGMILGIISLCAGPLAGVPALVCSGIGMSRPGGRGAAITGLVTGLLGTLVAPFLLIALLLPAVQKVREAATRTSDANNLKQMSLGMHMEADRRVGFAAPYARDNTGQPQTGVSFRVGLLPYIEQERLYRQFDLTQPWDSPRNRPHSNTVVPTYQTKYDGDPASTNTPYRVFHGGGALFNESGKPVTFNDITDGTANTIMLVHAAEQVPWAEPREFRYGPDVPLPQLGHRSASGANVAFADGSVRFLRKDVSERVLRAAITRAGGEAFSLD